MSHVFDVDADGFLEVGRLACLEPVRVCSLLILGG